MKAFIALSLAIMIYFAASDIYTPSLPIIAHVFGTTNEQAQETISYFFGASLIAGLFAGFLADRWGKKKIFIAGMLIFTIANIWASQADSIESLIFARIFQGIGGVTAPIIGYSLIQDLYPEEKILTLMGWFGFMIAVVPAVAPSVGGFLTEKWGWTSSFMLLAITSSISLLFLLLFLPKHADKKNERKHNFFQTYTTILQHRYFLSYALFIPLFSSVEWYMLTFLPFYGQRYLGLSPQEYGLFISMGIVWYGPGSYVGSIAGKKLGTNRSIFVGLLLGLFSFITALLVVCFAPRSLIGIYSAMSLVMITIAFLYPLTISKALSYFKFIRSSASALRCTIATFFAFLGGCMAENMPDETIWPLVIYIGVITTFSFLLYQTREKEHVLPPPVYPVT